MYLSIFQFYIGLKYLQKFEDEERYLTNLTAHASVYYEGSTWSLELKT